MKIISPSIFFFGIFIFTVIFFCLVWRQSSRVRGVEYGERFVVRNDDTVTTSGTPTTEIMEDITAGLETYWHTHYNNTNTNPFDLSIKYNKQNLPLSYFDDQNVNSSFKCVSSFPEICEIYPYVKYWTKTFDSADCCV